MNEIYHKLNRLLNQGQPFILVTLVEAHGSTPQDTGSKMLVTQNGLYAGTVGGGKIEARALDEATNLLASDKQNLFQEFNLKKDIGMTCGGTVKLYFEKHNVATWPIVIFGAGHVAQALIRLLQTMPCQITCFDTRANWLAKLPQNEQITPIISQNLVHEIDKISENSFVLLMTQGHGTDLPILAQALKQKKFRYLGVIGSKSKRSALLKELREANVPEETINNFYCPIGLPIGSNHVSEIAVSIAAQLLKVRDEN